MLLVLFHKEMKLLSGPVTTIFCYFPVFGCNEHVHQYVYCCLDSQMWLVLEIYLSSCWSLPFLPLECSFLFLTISYMSTSSGFSRKKPKLFSFSFFFSLFFFFLVYKMFYSKKDTTKCLV
jgi:hypothetical protein